MGSWTPPTRTSRRVWRTPWLDKSKTNSVNSADAWRPKPNANFISPSLALSKLISGHHAHRSIICTVLKECWEPGDYSNLTSTAHRADNVNIETEPTDGRRKHTSICYKCWAPLPWGKRGVALRKQHHCLFQTSLAQDGQVRGLGDIVFVFKIWQSTPFPPAEVFLFKQ